MWYHLLLAAGMAPPELGPELTTGMLVVFGIVGLALVLFITEVVPIDVSAIILLVLVVMLSPWTEVGPEAGLSGFASQATITVLAMFILSEGIRRTGVLRMLGNAISRVTRGEPRRQLAALVGISGGSAGFINNTPVVAMMIPMAVDIANRSDVSPSRYLMPMSFAAMMGGMLTVIGTSTNLLASDVSARLLDHPFSMFEFTRLGILVLGVGSVYLLLVGWHLTPQRIKPRRDPIELFEMDDYLAELEVGEGSSVAGLPVRDAIEALEVDLEILRIRRGERILAAPLAERRIQAGDVLIVRTDPSTLRDVVERPQVGLGRGDPVGPEKLGLEGRDRDGEEESDDAPGQEAGDATPDADDSPKEPPERVLAEVVILAETPLVGETLRSLNFGQKYQAWVLAIRRGSGVLHTKLNQTELRGGDTLLVQASPDAIHRLGADRNLVVGRVLDETPFRGSRIPVALGIVAGVVLAATTGLMPISVSALAGVVAMVVTGCLRANELYGAVDWNVIFLLAGVIPLGIALESTGGAAYLAAGIVGLAGEWHPVLVLFLFYLFTALVTEVVSNNASVVLMIPVAVGAAVGLDANPFAFVMAVTFAASTPMLTPVGYQTNLMVYGPGGYRFGDFFRVGAPLQLLLAVVTSLGIAAIWGV
jgi:di/tricarboxylate transporter